MILTVISLGIKNYLRDVFNILDSIIVIISIIDSILTFSNVKITSRGRGK